MQDQVTVRLPADLSHALKAASRRMQRKSSEIVRLALREFLGASSPSGARHADRVRGLIHDSLIREHSRRIFVYGRPLRSWASPRPWSLRRPLGASPRSPPRG